MLTPVHLHCTLRLLRARRTVEFSGGILEVLDPPQIERLGSLRATAALRLSRMATTGQSVNGALAFVADELLKITLVAFSTARKSAPLLSSTQACRRHWQPANLPLG
jgi:hypothetical protein